MSKRKSLYRVETYQDGEHQGYRYFKSKKAANAWLDELVEYAGHDLDNYLNAIDEAPAPRTIAELVDLLNRWGGHRDNG